MADRYMKNGGAGLADGTSQANAYDDTEVNFQAACDQLGINDVFYVMDDSVITWSANLDIDGTPGSVIAKPKILGVNSSWANDGSQFTLDFDSAAGLSAGVDQWHLENFRMINSVGDTWNSTTNSRRWYLKNIDIDNAGARGFDGVNRSDGTIITQCQFTNCTTDGLFGLDNIYIEYSEAASCNIGINFGTTFTKIDKCLIYDSTSYGVRLGAYSSISDSVIDDNGGAGVYSTSSSCNVKTCRITNNVGAGILSDGASALIYEDWNGFFGNSSETSETSGGKVESGGDSISLSADGYTNQTARDYNLLSSADAIGFEIKIGDPVSGSNIHHATSGLAPAYSTGATPTFAGIVDLIAYTDGFIRPRWAAATNKTGYKIYIRAGDSSVFSNAYYVKIVSSTLIECLVSSLQDGTRLLQDTTYYIGIRAINDTIEDSNTATIAFKVSANGTLIKLPVQVITPIIRN